MAHTPTSHRKPRKRSPWLAIASVFFLLIALIGIFLFFNNRSKQEIKTKTNASSHRKIVTSIKKKKWIKQKTPVKIPILMYHAVHVMDPSEAASANLIVAPDIFESHIKRLKKEGYYFLAPNEAYRALNENALPDKKVIWITFDDGNADFYTKAYPILKKYKVKATNNIITGFVQEGRESNLNVQQMLEMKQNGMSFIPRTYGYSPQSFSLNSRTTNPRNDTIKTVFRSKTLSRYSCDCLSIRALQSYNLGYC